MPTAPSPTVTHFINVVSVVVVVVDTDAAATEADIDWDLRTVLSELPSLSLFVLLVKCRRKLRLEMKKLQVFFKAWKTKESTLIWAVREAKVFWMHRLCFNSYHKRKKKFLCPHLLNTAYKKPQKGSTFSSKRYKLI